MFKHIYLTLLFESFGPQKPFLHASKNTRARFASTFKKASNNMNVEQFNMRHMVHFKFPTSKPTLRIVFAVQKRSSPRVRHSWWGRWETLWVRFEGNASSPTCMI